MTINVKNAEILKTDSFVNGEWVKAKSGAEFAVVDPGSGAELCKVPDNSADDVDAAVKAAHDAFQSYRKTTPRIRAERLVKWHNLVKEHKDDLAKIITSENGKPLAESYFEIDYACSFLWWFAGEAERAFGTTSYSSTAGRRVFTVKQPLGVCVALVPWNFPIAMILRKCGAALAAGCTVVAKPSPETPLTCLALAHLCSLAGFEKGVLNVLTTSLENTPPLSEALCKHPLVKKVTFTGSTRVGKLIASHCSEGLKKLSFELGGNCPYLVFDDANLDQAIEALVSLKWRNAGQACITANRVYVQSGVHDEFIRRLVSATKKLKVGHGTQDDTNVGPLTTGTRGLDKAVAHVEDAVRHGGKVETGGNKAEVGGDYKNGYFFEPTVISGMGDSMLITHEETFSPICAVYKFETEDEAVKSANNTSMGLASYFFTKNVDRTWRLLENLEAGMIGMNTGNASASESPFGGIKESGYGKESGKDVAINEYLITKTATLTVEDHY